MFKIRIAELTAELDNRYAHVEKQCQAYRVSAKVPSDIVATATEEEIERELALDGEGHEAGYAESICLYRSIASQLHTFDAFLMHGAVIGFEGKAYAFLAKSGTGKSTHIRLWRTHLKDGVLPVNGDKPILRFQGDALTAYGTPWAGKEGWQRNVGLPLAGICLLARGEANRIERLQPRQAVPSLMRQIYLPNEPMGAVATMALIDRLTASVPIYALWCDMSEEAVKTSFEAMTGLSFLQAKGKYQ
ncbi:MAG: hypothetical protein E7599_05760 [Ruminococcaceae bacterium]|nr:hypothetical protein [Oscillospiraceae bacterium]